MIAPFLPRGSEAVHVLSQGIVFHSFTVCLLTKDKEKSRREERDARLLKDVFLRCVCAETGVVANRRFVLFFHSVEL